MGKIRSSLVSVMIFILAFGGTATLACAQTYGELERKVKALESEVNKLLKENKDLKTDLANSKSEREKFDSVLHNQTAMIEKLQSENRDMAAKLTSGKTATDRSSTGTKSDPVPIKKNGAGERIGSVGLIDQSKNNNAQFQLQAGSKIPTLETGYSNKHLILMFMIVQSILMGILSIFPAWAWRKAYKKYGVLSQKYTELEISYKDELILTIWVGKHKPKIKISAKKLTIIIVLLEIVLWAAFYLAN